MLVFNIWFDPEVITHSATNFVEVHILKLISSITDQLTDIVLCTPSSNGITPLSIKTRSCVCISALS